MKAIRLATALGFGLAAWTTASAQQEFQSTPAAPASHVQTDGAAAEEEAKRASPADPTASDAIFFRAFGVQQLDGQVWARGHDYKMLFDATGATYTPALGREAPRNFPWTFTLDSIRRGDAVLFTAPEALPAPYVEGKRVEYLYGAGIVEAYDSRADGVEQTFTFEQPLMGSGELVVRGRIDTELTSAMFGEFEGGILFESDGYGGLSYGALTGIDADGATVAGSLRFDGEFLELVLPDSFVDGASYPLVLDPFIGTSFTVGGAVYDDIDPDVAYDASTDTYLVVWQREFSSSNIEVRAQRMTSTGTLIGSFLAITNAINVAMHPSVGNVNVTDQFLVAWQEGASVIGPWDIMCRRVNAADGSLSAIVTVAGTAADETDPDVGGDATLSDDEVIVVWDEEDVGIAGTQVNVPSGLDPSTFGYFSLDPDAPGSWDSAYPAISKSGGALGQYCVTWEREFFATGDYEIRAAAVTRQSIVLDPYLAVTNDVVVRERFPDVDGDGTTWVIAYQAEASAGDNDILCQPVRYTSPNLLTDGGETVVEADLFDDERSPAVSYAGPKYAVAWSDQSGSASYDLAIQTFSTVGCVDCGFEYGVALGSGFYRSGAEMASQVSGDVSLGSVDDDQMMIVWYAADLTAPPFDGEVLGQLFEAVGAGGSVLNLGGGCGGGGFLAVPSPVAIGNSEFTFDLSGADPIAFSGLFVLATAGKPVIPCGTCTAIALQLIYPSPAIVAGNSSFSAPIPCDTSIVGAQLDAQWVVLPTISAPCPLFPNVSVSNALRVTIGV